MVEKARSGTLPCPGCSARLATTASTAGIVWALVAEFDPELFDVVFPDVTPVLELFERDLLREPEGDGPPIGGIVPPCLEECLLLITQRKGKDKDKGGGRFVCFGSPFSVSLKLHRRG